MSRRILLVDDDPAVLRGVAGLLRDEGYGTETCSSAAEAFEAIGKNPPAAVILDLEMPGETGLSLLKRLPRPLLAPVIVLSGNATPGEAAQALKLGATDFVEKPPTAERLLTALQNALALRDLEDERERLREALAQPGNLIGESAAMAELRKLVARAGPSDSVVLIEGETGTGKERVSRALHLASGRKGRFVAVNCAAIPAQLLESELFGAEKGAFTGANARRLGRFEQAQGGTL
ncbi:MAG TPA: sigma 54-interacting transcriptional regulator, partial [Myxococcales bacterium]|nr:sigma 54-interacting transcriptional regulator [Myxococcales bacterium]